MLKNYLVTYDLHKPHYDYAALDAMLSAFSASRRLLGSVWIIRSPLSAEGILDLLCTIISPGSSVMVAGLTDEADWFGLDPIDDAWMHNVLGTSETRIH